MIGGQGSEDQLTTDAQLIQKAQNGDTDAFGILYERYAQTIFRFVYSRLDNRLDAEDLTEEIFVRVWRSLPDYREQGAPFVSYLFQVSRNAVIDFYRRSRQTRQTLSVENQIVDVVDERPDPAESFAAGVEHKELRAVLAKLHEEYRVVLELRFLSNLSPDETAQVMGKSIGAIRVLQHRALAALRKLLPK
jgi:RNA polymerase sigma-70 factor (ECF subfamily)